MASWCFLASVSSLSGEHTEDCTFLASEFVINPALFYLLPISFQGVCGALTVLMRDAIKPNLMQTLEV